MTDRPSRHFNAIMLPKMVFCFRKRKTILMHVDCTSNFFWLMAHSFKTIRFNKLALTGFAKKTHFYSYFSFSSAIFDNIFGRTIDTILGHHFTSRKRKTSRYLYHSFNRLYQVSVTFINNRLLQLLTSPSSRDFRAFRLSVVLVISRYCLFNNI